MTESADLPSPIDVAARYGRQSSKPGMPLLAQELTAVTRNLDIVFAKASMSINNLSPNTRVLVYFGSRLVLDLICLRYLHATLSELLAGLRRVSSGKGASVSSGDYLAKFCLVEYVLPFCTAGFERRWARSPKATLRQAALILRIVRIGLRALDAASMLSTLAGRQQFNTASGFVLGSRLQRRSAAVTSARTTPSASADAYLSLVQRAEHSWTAWLRLQQRRVGQRLEDWLPLLITGASTLVSLHAEQALSPSRPAETAHEPVDSPPELPAHLRAERSGCYLCKQPRNGPAVFLPSCLVYCGQCIRRYVHEHGKDPITGVPGTTQDILPLYLAA